MNGPAPARHAAILAGGAGSRMGGGKASIDLGGRPLIAYALESARSAGLEPLVVAKAASQLPELDCEIVIEPDEPVHPAAGIVAALERSGAPIVVVPCDAPLIPPELLLALARSSVPFAMPTHPREQPLVARYTPELLPRLRSALSAGESMRALAADLGGERLGADEVSAYGDPAWMFANVNDPDDLEPLAAEVRRRAAAP